MSEEDDLSEYVEEAEDAEDALGIKINADDAHTRKRLEEKLEEVRLRKLTQDYDFD